ncbi:methyltransferase domain-containing protein [Micromonospora purpureochromogenes]|uniref:methyltransferase domain-containing protein n=1 Tax=Micromonospora purpureochromogenes TaxID=47872 RepID=UPI001E53E281|nr:methyltransferase domain-containing protein [Micromonospora purpureochromogenes]
MAEAGALARSCKRSRLGRIEPGQALATDYDSFAEAYATGTESNLINGYYTRPAMLDLARQRLGDGTALHQGGLGGDPLPFPDASFDEAIACLVLHYLEDWTARSPSCDASSYPAADSSWPSTIPSSTT